MAERIVIAGAGLATTELAIEQKAQRGSVR
jgi:hypothetical protein